MGLFNKIFSKKQHKHSMGFSHNVEKAKSLGELKRNNVILYKQKVCNKCESPIENLNKNQVKYYNEHVFCDLCYEYVQQCLQKNKEIQFCYKCGMLICSETAVKHDNNLYHSWCLKGKSTAEYEEEKSTAEYEEQTAKTNTKNELKDIFLFRKTWDDSERGQYCHSVDSYYIDIITGMPYREHVYYTDINPRPGWASPITKEYISYDRLLAFAKMYSEESYNKYVGINKENWMDYVKGMK